MKLFIGSTISAFFAVLFSFYVLTPLPDGAVQRRSVTAAIARFIFDVADLLEYVGICSSFKALQRATSIITPSLDDEVLDIRDEEFDGVKVRVYRPKNKEALLPGLIFIHGGGWNLPGVDIYDPMVRLLAKKLEMVVASIEYRLAPDYPFPVPFDDCLAATKYFLANAKRYNVDENRIGISGDSAGGNLAMVVVHNLSRLTTLPSLKLLALIYPVVQMVDLHLPSYQEYGDRRFLLTKSLMSKFWVNYIFGKTIYWNEFFQNVHVDYKTRKELSTLVDRNLLGNRKTKENISDPKENITLQRELKTTVTNKNLSPLLLSDQELKLLPKTYLLTAEYDILNNEGFILSKRLQNIGHHIVYKNWNGVQHGFLLDFSLEIQNKALQHLVDFIKTEI